MDNAFVRGLGELISRVTPPTTKLDEGVSTILPVVIKNGRFTPKAKEEAQSPDVQLIGATDLWRLLKETPCTPAEIEAMEDRRLATMRDVLAAIDALVL